MAVLEVRMRAAKAGPLGAVGAQGSTGCSRQQGWGARQGAAMPVPPPLTAHTPPATRVAPAQRRECKDWVACYSTRDWQLLQRFLVDTRDAADLAWSPNGAHLAVWDNSLGHKVRVSTPPGASLHARVATCPLHTHPPLMRAQVCVYGPDGQLRGSHSSPGDGLGVKAAVWAPGGDGLAIGSYDQAAYVLNNVTWQPLIECHHGSPVAAAATLVAYQEQEEGGRGVLEPVQVRARAHAKAHLCPCPRRGRGCPHRAGAAPSGAACLTTPPSPTPPHAVNNNTACFPRRRPRALAARARPSARRGRAMWWRPCHWRSPA